MYFQVSCEHSVIIENMKMLLEFSVKHSIFCQLGGKKIP